jgi:hypothetical protein
MKKMLWFLAVLIVAFSSCNQLPVPSADNSDQSGVSPRIPNCDVPNPPPICTDPPPPPPPPPPPSNKAFIQLNQLRVVDKQEFFGDEPYFVTIGFRSKYRTPNSTRTFWNGYINGDYFSGLGNGAVRTLPSFMNGVSFSNLNRVSLANILAGQMPEVIGAISISIEDDWTSDSTMIGLMNDLAASLKTMLVGLIEQGQLNLADPASSIKQAVAQLKSSFEPSFWQKVKLFLGSYGDPNDVIGFHAFVYAVTDYSLPFTAPVDPTLSAGVLPYGDNPLTVRFQGDGAIYDVSSNIKYLPAP